MAFFIAYIILSIALAESVSKQAVYLVGNIAEAYHLIYEGRNSK